MEQSVPGIMSDAQVVSLATLNTSMEKSEAHLPVLSTITLLHAAGPGETITPELPREDGSLLGETHPDSAPILLGITSPPVHSEKMSRAASVTAATATTNLSGSSAEDAANLMPPSRTLADVLLAVTQPAPQTFSLGLPLESGYSILDPCPPQPPSLPAAPTLDAAATPDPQHIPDEAQVTLHWGEHPNSLLHHQHSLQQLAHQQVVTIGNSQPYGDVRLGILDPDPGRADAVVPQPGHVTSKGALLAGLSKTWPSTQFQNKHQSVQQQHYRGDQIKPLAVQISLQHCLDSVMDPTLSACLPSNELGLWLGAEGPDAKETADASENPRSSSAPRSKSSRYTAEDLGLHYTSVRCSRGQSTAQHAVELGHCERPAEEDSGNWTSRLREGPPKQVSCLTSEFDTTSSALSGDNAAEAEEVAALAITSLACGITPEQYVSRSEGAAARKRVEPAGDMDRSASGERPLPQRASWAGRDARLLGSRDGCSWREMCNEESDDDNEVEFLASIQPAVCKKHGKYHMDSQVQRQSACSVVGAQQQPTKGARPQSQSAVGGREVSGKRRRMFLLDVSVRSLRGKNDPNVDIRRPRMPPSTSSAVDSDIHHADTAVASLSDETEQEVEVGASCTGPDLFTGTAFRAEADGGAVVHPAMERRKALCPHMIDRAVGTEWYDGCKVVPLLWPVARLQAALNVQCEANLPPTTVFHFQPESGQCNDCSAPGGPGASSRIVPSKLSASSLGRRVIVQVLCLPPPSTAERTVYGSSGSGPSGEEHTLAVLDDLERPTPATASLVEARYAHDAGTASNFETHIAGVESEVSAPVTGLGPPLEKFTAISAEPLCRGGCIIRVDATLACARVLLDDNSELDLIPGDPMVAAWWDGPAPLGSPVSRWVAPVLHGAAVSMAISRLMDAAASSLPGSSAEMCVSPSLAGAGALCLLAGGARLPNLPPHSSATSFSRRSLAQAQRNSEAELLPDVATRKLWGDLAKGASVGEGRWKSLDLAAAADGVRGLIRLQGLAKERRRAEKASISSSGVGSELAGRSGRGGRLGTHGGGGGRPRRLEISTKNSMIRPKSRSSLATPLLQAGLILPACRSGALQGALALSGNELPASTTRRRNLQLLVPVEAVGAEPSLAKLVTEGPAAVAKLRAQKSQVAAAAAGSAQSTDEPAGARKRKAPEKPAREAAACRETIALDSGFVPHPSFGPLHCIGRASDRGEVKATTEGDRAFAQIIPQSGELRLVRLPLFSQKTMLSSSIPTTSGLHSYVLSYTGVRRRKPWFLCCVLRGERRCAHTAATKQ